jgi:hypothetical protein
LYNEKEIINPKRIKAMEDIQCSVCGIYNNPYEGDGTCKGCGAYIMDESEEYIMDELEEYIMDESEE